MFDHLDDPCPPTFGEAQCALVVRTVRRRQRRRRAAATSAGLTLSAVTGATLFLRGQARQLDRIEIAGLSPTEPTALAPTVPVDLEPPASAALASGEVVEPLSAPVNVLLVGLDGANASDTTSVRADMIAIVHLDPQAGQVRVLSIPRDLYVHEGDSGTRINALAAEPSRLVTAIHDTLGVEVQHYVAIGYDGFVDLVDLAGGIDIPFDRPVRDRHVSFHIDTPGCHRLDGQASLAYARSRYLEWYDSQSEIWNVDATASVGRSTRQSDLMERLYRKVLTADYGPADQIRILTDVVDDITVDRDLTLTGLRQMFATAAAIGPNGFVVYDLVGAVNDATIANSAVLELDTLEAARIVSAFESGQPGTALPPPAFPSAVLPTDDAACS